MAITFDELYTPLNRKLHFYDSGTNTTSALDADSTNFDYFPDTAVVGDALVYSNIANMNNAARLGKFGSIQFNVGTALAATSITVAWEYYDTDGNWTAFSNVTDNTNAFQNTGQNTIQWDVPFDWDDGASLGGVSFGTNYFTVRCRITAISGLTEGGQQTTDTIKVGNNAYVIDTETTTDLLGDILASDPGRPGITVTDDIYYKIPHSFYLKNNSDTKIKGNITIFTAGGIIIESGSTFTLGDILNGAATDGVRWIRKLVDGTKLLCVGTFNAYGSYIKYDLGDSSDNVLLQECYLKDLSSRPKSTWTFKNTYIDGGGVVMRIDSAPTVDDLTITNQSGFGAGVYLNSGNLEVDFYNPVFINNSTDISVLSVNSGITVYNPSGFSVAKVNISQSTGYVDVGYEVDIKVVDKNNNAISGATVTITDSSGTTYSDTTDGSGDIATQEIKVKKYEGTSKTETDYNDMEIEIRASGYKTYKGKLTLSEKRKLTISMQRMGAFNISPAVQFNE